MMKYFIILCVLSFGLTTFAQEIELVYDGWLFTGSISL